MTSAVAPLKVATDIQTEEDVGEEFEGPIRDRQCRDVAVLFIFVVCICGMGFVAWRAATLGNPFRMIYGVDSWGNVCNQNNRAIQGVSLSGRNNVDLQNLFYFNGANFLSVVTSSQSSVRLCVNTCPPATLTTVAELQAFADVAGSRLCRYDVNTSSYHGGSSDGLGTCPPLPVAQHEEFLFRCVPESLTNKLDHVLSSINSLLNVIDDNFLEKVAADLRATWKELLWFCGLAFVVGLAVVVLLQFVAAIVIWLMVITMVTGSLTATGVCWYHYQATKTTFDDLPADQKTTQLEDKVHHWLIGSICVTVVTAIMLLVLLAVRKHIRLVVQLFREAGKAIWDMPMLLAQPFMTLLWLILSVAMLAVVMVYIETAGNPAIQGGEGFVEYEEDSVLKVLKWYYLFMCIWVLQFVTACHKLTIAGAVAIWYFTRNKRLLSFPICVSIGRVIRFHLGSLAFGSLIVAIVVFIRMVLSFIENRLKGRTHPIAMFIFKCFKCCLWCFEKFLKFLNSNAYIEIAIFGYGFCKAARQAFQIIVNNAVRLAAINSVGDFVLFLGKVATVAVVVIVAMEILSVRDDIHYVWLPATLAGIFAYLIASCFLSVYEMTIDTIFICFAEDSRMNDGLRKPYFMSVGLQRCMSAGLRRGSVVSGRVHPAPT